MKLNNPFFFSIKLTIDFLQLCDILKTIKMKRWIPDAWILLICVFVSCFGARISFYSHISLESYRQFVLWGSVPISIFIWYIGHFRGHELAPFWWFRIFMLAHWLSSGSRIRLLLKHFRLNVSKELCKLHSLQPTLAKIAPSLPSFFSRTTSRPTFKKLETSSYPTLKWACCIGSFLQAIKKLFADELLEAYFA